jgi:aryl-alcohol dehydrogenase-like predicted oxidoreductase
MRYRHLGSTGILVSPYCLGAMMFGSWANADHEDGVRIIHKALDAGVNFVDTADAYSHGESEVIVGKALKGRRDSVVLATKVHFAMGNDTKDPNQQGNSRRWIIHEVEQSLKRLGTDYIDLYQIHRPDPRTDIEETLSVLSDLIHAGKVRAIGSSTFPTDRIVEAQWAAERRGYERFRCEQPPYSLLTRGIEASVLPACERYGMGVIAWSPLGGGWLTGRWRGVEIDMTTGRASRLPARFDPALPQNQRKLDLVEDFEAVASDAGISLTHMSIAFVIAHPAVTSAIIGPRTMEQLDDLLAGVDVSLDDATLDRLDEIVKPGRNTNSADAGWEPPDLTNAQKRRRPAALRAAAG